MSHDWAYDALQQFPVPPLLATLSFSRGWYLERERENPLIALGAYQGSSGTEASLFTWVIPIQESGNAQTGKLPLGDEAHTRREGGQPEIVVQWYTDWR